MKNRNKIILITITIPTSVGIFSSFIYSCYNNRITNNSNLDNNSISLNSDVKYINDALDQNIIIDSISIDGKSSVIQGDNFSFTSIVHNRGYIPRNELKYAWYTKDDKTEELIPNSDIDTMTFKSTNLLKPPKSTILKVSYKDKVCVSNVINLKISPPPSPHIIDYIRLKRIFIKTDQYVGYSGHIYTNPNAPELEWDLLKYRWYTIDDYNKEYEIPNQNKIEIYFESTSEYIGKKIFLRINYKDKEYDSETIVVQKPYYVPKFDDEQRTKPWVIAGITIGTITIVVIITFLIVYNILIKPYSY